MEQISDYLAGFAKERKLFFLQDALKNIIIVKEATPGYEQEPAVILQGHMDILAVIQHQRAVQKQHVAVIKLHIISQQLAGKVTNIYQRDFPVSLHQKGCNAAAERIPEDNKPPVRIRGVIFYLQQRGVTLSGQYTVRLLEHPFYGVYRGQAALPLPAEEIYYLDSTVLDSCRVFDYETNGEISVYDMEKAVGRDPYEMFLAGPRSEESL